MDGRRDISPPLLSPFSPLPLLTPPYGRTHSRLPTHPTSKGRFVTVSLPFVRFSYFPSLFITVILVPSPPPSSCPTQSFIGNPVSRDASQVDRPLLRSSRCIRSRQSRRQRISGTIAIFDTMFPFSSFPRVCIIEWVVDEWGRLVRWSNADGADEWTTRSYDPVSLHLLYYALSFFEFEMEWTWAQLVDNLPMSFNISTHLYCRSNGKPTFIRFGKRSMFNQYEWRL